MTPEELDEATVEEAKRRINKNYEIGIGWLPGDVARLAARLARENWTPPEPVVDPDILAFREWLMEREPDTRGPSYEYDADFWDNSMSAQAYLAGARMAREQERERAKVRAKVLVEFAEDIAKFSLNYGVRANRALAKYREAL